MQPTAHIVPELETDTEGQPIVLRCTGATNLPKATAQLVHEHHISSQWLGPDGQVLITGSDFITGDPINSDSEVSLTLTVREAKLHHAGLYTCQVTITLPDNDTATASTQYHIVLLSEY